MKTLNLIEIFKSNYCKLVFIFSLILVSSLIPKRIFYSYYTILGVAFIIITALTLTCFIRNIKEKALSARNNGASTISIITIILGFGTLQTCAIGSPFCGASIGAGFFAIFFPGTALNLMGEYSLWIIIISIIIQILSLHFMKCFKFKCKEVNKK